MHTTDRRIDADALRGFLHAVLTSAGARETDAAGVAAHLADANLKGHDSHGAGLLPVYLRHIRKDLVRLDAEDRIVRETGVLLQVDAGGGWGAPAGFRLIDRAAAKAREHGLAATRTLPSAMRLVAMSCTKAGPPRIRRAWPDSNSRAR